MTAQLEVIGKVFPLVGPVGNQIPHDDGCRTHGRTREVWLGGAFWKMTAGGE